MAAMDEAVACLEAWQRHVQGMEYAKTLIALMQSAEAQVQGMTAERDRLQGAVDGLTTAYQVMGQQIQDAEGTLAAKQVEMDGVQRALDGARDATMAEEATLAMLQAQTAAVRAQLLALAGQVG